MCRPVVTSSRHIITITFRSSNRENNPSFSPSISIIRSFILLLLIFFFAVIVINTFIWPVQCEMRPFHPPRPRLPCFRHDTNGQSLYTTFAGATPYTHEPRPPPSLCARVRTHTHTHAHAHSVWTGILHYAVYTAPEAVRPTRTDVCKTYFHRRRVPKNGPQRKINIIYWHVRTDNE